MALHLDTGRLDACFYDLETTNQEQIEVEADNMAREALVTSKEWERSDLLNNNTSE